RAREPVVLRIIPGAPPADSAGQERGRPGEAGETTEGLVTVSNPCASGGMLEIFLEGVFPPMLVQVSGDAPIAPALRSVGEALGYEIRPVGPPGQPVAPDASVVIGRTPGRDRQPPPTSQLAAGRRY